MHYSLHIICNDTSKLFLISDGLIAINKPFGIPLQKSGLAGPNESLFSLEEALIPLASLLKVDKILPAKMTERFSSGVSLFASEDKVMERIQRSYNVNRTKRILTYKYLAVTIGEPQPAAGKATVGMGFFEHKDVTRKMVNNSIPVPIPILIISYFTANNRYRLHQEKGGSWFGERDKSKLQDSELREGLQFGGT